MSIAQMMLGEFEAEAKITRRFLEQVPADKLTVSVINKYLELKGRGAI